MPWMKFEAHTTTAKRRAAKKAADAADRKAKADRQAQDARAARDVLVATNLYGGPVDQAIHAEALERAKRKLSLRPRYW